MSKKKKAPKVETAYTPQLAAPIAPTASAAIANLPVSADVENLRAQFASQTSLLTQQMEAQRKQYEASLSDVSRDYESQGSILQNQLSEEQKKQGILTQQLLKQQEDAKSQYEKQQTYYSELMRTQQEQASKQQEELNRSLLELESRQASTQKDATSLFTNAANRNISATEAKKRGSSSTANYTNVTRNSGTVSLLRR